MLQNIRCFDIGCNKYLMICAITMAVHLCIIQYGYLCFDNIGPLLLWCQFPRKYGHMYRYRRVRSKFTCYILVYTQNIRLINNIVFIMKICLLTSVVSGVGGRLASYSPIFINRAVVIG